MRYTCAKNSLLVCLIFKFNWVSYILTGSPHPGPGTRWTWGCAVLVYENILMLPFCFPSPGSGAALPLSRAKAQQPVG